MISATQAPSRATTDYHFVTVWKFAGTPEEVSAILEDVHGLGRWWPSVYLSVVETEPGDQAGVGKKVSLWTKGWLPYTLRWNFTVVESDSPHGFVIEASGDFAGVGRWIIRPAGTGTQVTFDWQIRADKPLLRTFSWLLRPIFSWNHAWAMRQGEISLGLELRRRRGESNVPMPPCPTWPHRSRKG